MKKSIKPFVIGTLVGSLLTISSAAFADDGIQAIKVLLNRNAHISVEGKAVTLSNPVLTYDGKTYVYLKDIGKLLGASVNWNASKKTVEITRGGAEMSAGTEAAPQVIATYEGGTVTDREFAKYAFFFGIVNPQTASYMNDPQLKKQFLQEYIGYKLLYSPLAGTKLSAEEEADLDQFMSQFNSFVDQSPDLKASAAKVGYAESDGRQFYTMITLALDDMKNKVTDAQAKAQFDETKGDYNIVSVRHILVSTTDTQTGQQLRTDAEALQLAKEVKQLLEDGGDWTELAKQYSDDPGSSGNGGLYENEQARNWIAEFKNAANTQPIGTIGDPVKTDYGYHVIEVEKRETKTFEQLSQDDREAIRQAVASEHMDDFMQNVVPGKITKLDPA